MPNTSNTPSAAWWKRLVSFFAQFILFIGLVILLNIGIGLLLGLTAFSQTLTSIGGLIYDWSILLASGLGSIYIIDRFLLKKGLNAYGFSTDGLGKSLLVGVFTSSLILLLCFAILLTGGWVNVSNVNFQPALFFSWALFFLIQPLVEEVFMRAFLQTQLHRHFGKYAGLFITALAFALIHGSNDHISPLAIVQIFTGGLLIGCLFLYTQNIWAAFGMHASWNFLQSTVLGFAVSGMDTYHILETTTTGPDWLTGGHFGVEGSVLSLVFILMAIIYFWRQVFLTKIPPV